MGIGKNKTLEAIFRSIALPGFAQLLNGKLFKGLLFIGLEFLINSQANFNGAIRLSFHGQIQQAIEQTNYSWLMYYPCLYTFAMWDAFKDAGGGKEPFSFLPLVLSAFFLTIGLIYSSTFTIGGILFGPVWLPILCLPIGLIVGMILKIAFVKLIS